MMDQLASIGIEFQPEAIDRIFDETRQYYENPPKKPVTLSSLFNRPQRQWAIPEIYEKHKPVRPWALGMINEADIGVYRLAGRINRTPSEYKRADPDTGNPTNTFMTHTNERIHSSVRIRLELEGLGPDDKGPYDCPALLKNDKWRLRQARVKARDPIPPDADWAGEYVPNGRVPKSESLRWIWQWNGPRDEAPPVRTMIEENLGPYEKRLLHLNDGMYALFTCSPNETRYRRENPSQLLFLVCLLSCSFLA
jgi:hypothetical protein